MLVEAARLRILLVDVEAAYAQVFDSMVQQATTNTLAPHLGRDEQHLERVFRDTRESDESGRTIGRCAFGVTPGVTRSARDRHHEPGHLPQRAGHVRRDGIDLLRRQKVVRRFDRRAPHGHERVDQRLRPLVRLHFDQTHVCGFAHVSHPCLVSPCLCPR